MDLAVRCSRKAVKLNHSLTWLIVTWWHPLVSRNLVNIDSRNGFLPGGTKPLPESMLTYHQRGPVVFMQGQFYGKCWRYQSVNCVGDWRIWNHVYISQGSKSQPVDITCWQVHAPQTVIVIYDTDRLEWKMALAHNRFVAWDFLIITRIRINQPSSGSGSCESILHEDSISWNPFLHDWYVVMGSFNFFWC